MYFNKMSCIVNLYLALSSQMQILGRFMLQYVKNHMLSLIPRRAAEKCGCVAIKHVRRRGIEKPEIKMPL